MKVTVDNLSDCKKLLRIEEDAAAVDATIEKVTTEYMRHASFPGFRPGKAPRQMVFKAFKNDIIHEAERNLIRETLTKAREEQKLDFVSINQPEEIQFAPGQPLSYVVTVETAPDFELPEYKGLPAKREVRTITEEDVTRAIDLLRSQQSRFEPVSRPIQQGDVAVINYTGTCEGKPLTDFNPTARGLAGKDKFWIKIEQGEFLPGFTEQLIGASAGETRTVTVNFPADFVIKEVAGKTALYQVTIVEVREKKLPEADDNFAKSYGAENMAALRAGVRADLEKDLAYKQNASIRSQVVKELMSKVSIKELPESFVEEETRQIVFDIVAENRRRGISKEIIEKEKDNIHSAALASARERVKAAFVFKKIAQKEKIEVSSEDLINGMAFLASQANMELKAFIKEVQQRDGSLEKISESILTQKVIDFLAKNAKVEDVPPGTLNQDAAPALTTPE